MTGKKLIQTAFPALDVSLDEKVKRAIDLLREHEEKALALSPDGYWLAFSGGKDSIVILRLAQDAGVKYQTWYNQTTIDPPELVRFVKTFPSVRWNRPQRNFFRALIDSHGLPSRIYRWCCEEFKERGGDGLVKMLGVRTAESVRRKKQWSEITPWRSMLGGFAVCPIVHWSDQDVWEFIWTRKLAYCSLYDEGWKRLGCIGCPMAGKMRHVEFARWPGFHKAWLNATRKCWAIRHDKLNRLGQPFYCSRFKSGDEFFEWWLSDNPTPKEDANECLGLYDSQ